VLVGCTGNLKNEHLTMARDHIPLKTQLAAALSQLAEIPYEHARAMSADQIISLFHRDHGIFHAWGGADEHWNLRFRLIADHREKTKIDVGIIAKAKRLTKAQEAFRARMLAKQTGGDIAPSQSRRSWPSMSFPKSSRKLPSRPFAKKGVRP